MQSILDAIKQLDKVPVAIKNDLESYIIQYLTSFSKSYSVNYDDSVEPSKTINAKLKKIENKSKSLKAELNGLSWQTLSSLSFELERSSEHFKFEDLSGTSQTTSFSGSKLWHVIDDIEKAAVATAKTGRRPKDSALPTLVGFCYSLFKNYSSQRLSRDGDFAKFTQDVFNAVFVEQATDCSGAIKIFYDKNRDLFPAGK